MLLRQVVCLAEGRRAKGTRDRQEREAIATCELAVGPVLHDTGWLACFAVHPHGQAAVLCVPGSLLDDLRSLVLPGVAVNRLVRATQSSYL